MKTIDDWLGFQVPARDNNNVRHRRVDQGDHAMKKLDKYIPPDRRKCVVQAGANWGYWPARLAAMFERVYTFEPDPVCFSCLAMNTAGLTNVIRLQAVLGDKPAFVDLWRDVDTTGNQYVDGGGMLPTLRIDDLGLDVCDLIYLDVEGSEAKAIRGALATIDRCKPFVVFEERQSFTESVKETRQMLFDYDHIGAIGADIVLAPR